MTPKEKAKDLSEKFGNNASIVVDEIIEAIRVFNNSAEWVLYESMGWQYWQKVKEEVEIYD